MENTVLTSVCASGKNWEKRKMDDCLRSYEALDCTTAYLLK